MNTHNDKKTSWFWHFASSVWFESSQWGRYYYYYYWKLKVIYIVFMCRSVRNFFVCPWQLSIKIRVYANLYFQMIVFHQSSKRPQRIYLFIFDLVWPMFVFLVCLIFPIRNFWILHFKQTSSSINSKSRLLPKFVFSFLSQISTLVGSKAMS